MAVQQVIGAEPPEHEVESSALDQETHAEMLHLYDESAATIRFAKSQQWASLAATLVIFAALVVLGSHNPERRELVKFIVISSFVITAGSLYTLALYQAWQNTERDKLRTIAAHLSSLTREIRSLKSTREANVHRYTLLGFMFLAVLLGNAFAVTILAPLYQ